MHKKKVVDVHKMQDNFFILDKNEIILVLKEFLLPKLRVDKLGFN